MKTITINKRSYCFAENWNELTQAQILQLMQVLFLKKYKAEEMLLQMIRVISGIRYGKFLMADTDELAEYFYLLAPFLGDKIVFTKNQLPVYQGFHGPDDDCSNLRMKEFTYDAMR